jgi:hypothetical protein
MLKPSKTIGSRRTSRTRWRAYKRCVRRQSQDHEESFVTQVTEFGVALRHEASPLPLGNLQPIGADELAIDRARVLSRRHVADGEEPMPACSESGRSTSLRFWILVRTAPGDDAVAALGGLRFGTLAPGRCATASPLRPVTQCAEPASCAPPPSASRLLLLVPLRFLRTNKRSPMQTEKPKPEKSVTEQPASPQKCIVSNPSLSFCHRCGFPHAQQFCPRCGHRQCVSCGDG